MSLLVKDEEHYQNVLIFATETSQLEQLQEQLEYLRSYACHETPEDTRCELYKDFAPYSFYFVMYKKNKQTGEYQRWFNGGLLWFNNGETGVNGPQYSVRLGELTRGWQIHT